MNTKNILNGREDEKALLGSLLLGADIPDGITEPVFYDERHARYFRVIKKLRDEGIAKPDIKMLVKQLEDWDDLKNDDYVRVADLTNEVASGQNVGYYAGKVIESHKILLIERAIDKTKTAIKEHRPADEIAEALRKSVTDTNIISRPFFGIKSISNDEEKEVDWFVDKYIPGASVALLMADSNTGKTFVGVDIMMSAASGIPWHGHKVNQGSVLFVAAEGMNGLNRRIAAWRKAHGIYGDLPIYGATTPLALTDPRTASAVIDTINETMPNTPPVAIFIDTLARCFGEGDENSNADASSVIRTIDAIKDAFPQVTVFIIHHVGHSEQKRARGASAFRGAMDSEYLLELKGGKTLLDSTLVMSCTKMKDAEYPPDIAFKAERVDLPELNGKPRNSLVLHRVNSIPETSPETKPKGENQVSIMRLLNKLHTESGDGVVYEKLRGAAKERGIGNSGWYKAYDALKDDKHLIAENNGICYPSNAIPLKVNL
jgi:hypothetical protein